ncbi:hypothetical protein [Corallococcus sicarius]|uniref:Tetratricopeptide repeat protein n=1 Tax=Corallococcus sicarius TaxID=2316726 RepID=A0A3A8NI50_9BACT|nr:hypothetical protein [Corallococcus sicarius]RKH41861.1 hypothetical protein D7X12_17125 [Corallococcus sicarius]
MRGALAQVCQDAARLLREGQAARAYSGLVAASRTLPMTPRLAAVLVRHALRAGTEREVISLLDAAMVAERGEVRREVRRQLSRVLRRSGQEARAAAVLNGLLLMDAPGDARARFVMDVLRERVAKGAPSRQEPEDDESRTKTVEVSALALSDPERGNTVLELPTVPVEVVKGASARAATVQVPLGEWAAVGRAAARGPEFPWEDEGPGRARAVTPAERAVASPGARDTGPVDAGGSGGPVGPADGAATQPVAEEEAPAAGRADAALSFHSTEFPFVTGDSAAAVSGPAPSAVPSVTTLEVSPTVDVAQVAEEKSGGASSVDVPQEKWAHPGSLDGGSAVPPSPLQQGAPVSDGSPKELSANSTVVTGSSAPGDSASTEAGPPNEPGTKSTSAPDSNALRDAVLLEAASAEDLDAESIAAPELSSSLDALAEGASAKDLDAKSTVAPEQPVSVDAALLEVGGSSRERDAKSAPAPGQSASVDAALAEVASVKASEAKPTAAQEQPSSLDTAPTAVASEKASEAKPTAALQPSSMLDAAPTAAASAKEREAKSTAAQEQSSSLDAARTEAAPAKDLAAKSAATPNPAAQPEATASGAQAPAPRDSTLTSQRGAPRLLDSVLVPGAPSKAFDEDEPTSEMIPPRPLDSVLVPGAPSKAFDEEEPTSEITPPARSDAETDKDASGSTRTGDKKSRTKSPAPSLRRTTVLVPAASNPAFDEEESTSEVVVAPPDAGPPQAATPPTRDSGRFPSVKPTGSGADADAELAAPPAAPPAALTPEEGAELARSQRQESLLIARQAWRELAQLYLKRADRAKAAPERAEALTRLAEVMENELQDSAGAARMYREIVELTGERTALREQVRLLSQREDASIVRRALDDAIQRARTSRARAIALLTRGERLLNMGSRSKAREDFEAADALVPGLLPVLAGLVRCASDKERAAFTERLRAACAAAPRRAPDRLDALRVLAQTAEESLGDLRIAQWAWAEVLAESPDNEQPREHLLALARRLGDLPALSQLLHAQLAREPRGPAARKAHLERVATLEAMGDAGAALAELRQAVRFEPGHKEAWLLLAERCIEREQLGEAAWAMENAATATESDEERQRTWERLALFCREVLHNAERARIYARRAESLRKAREDRARPPPPEPPRTAPPPAPGVPPPSVLVAPPVTTGLIPASRKDLSDEVTANTDVPSMNAAEEDATSAASAKRSARAKDGAAPKSAARVDAGAPQGSTATGDLSGNARASSAAPDAPDSIAASRKARSEAKPTAAVKAPSGSHASVAEVAPGARKGAAAKAPSGKHASVAAASPSTEASRRSESAKAPSGSPPSLAESAPGPSATARTPSAKAARGTAKDPGRRPRCSWRLRSPRASFPRAARTCPTR